MILFLLKSSVLSCTPFWPFNCTNSIWLEYKRLTFVLFGAVVDCGIVDGIFGFKPIGTPQKSQEKERTALSIFDIKIQIQTFFAFVVYDM